MFDFLKDDTSLPFFPKCTPVDPAASPVKSGGDAEDDVETCTAVDPTTAEPSAAEDVPMTGAVDDGWPTTKDFDDRIRSLLTALAREHINTERCVSHMYPLLYLA